MWYIWAYIIQGRRLTENPREFSKPRDSYLDFSNRFWCIKYVTSAKL